MLKDEVVQSSVEGVCTKEEMKLRAIFASSPDAITVTDLNGNIIDCNQATLDMGGFSSKDEVIGKKALEVIAKKDHERAMENLKKTLEQGSVRNIEYTFLAKDGREYPAELSASVIQDSSGNPTGFVAITKDITERKNAETKLRESEEKYRNLVENSKDAIAIVDFKGNILFANKAAERLTGYSAQEEKGINIRAITPRRLWLKSIAMLLKARLGKAIPYFEYELKRKDGTLIPVETGGQAIFKDGKPVAIQIITRDITERKKAEEALQESEERFRRLSEAPFEAVVIHDKGKILDVNQTFAEMFGYELSEVIGKNALDFTAPESRDLALKNILSGREKPYEVMGLRKDGSTFVIEVCGRAFPYKGRIVRVAAMRDVSDRKKDEEALRKSEERWRSLAENAPNIIVIIDRLGTIQFINRTVVDARPEEIAGKSIYDFIGPEHHNLVKKTIEQVFQTGEGGSYEISGVGPEGSVSWYATQVGPIKQDGQIVSATLITTDITERKNMEEQLEEYSAHLEEKVEERTIQLKKAEEQLLKAERFAAIGEVANMVGHDLRNPLQVITNTLYLSEKKAKSIPITEKEILEKHGFLDLRSGLKEQVEYMEKIVSDLQDYARTVKPMPVEIGLHQLINRTLSSLTVPENVKVSIVVEKGFPQLTLDPTLMQRVFSNLITNAVQEMPNGGKLTIRASKKEETALISIEDTGAGISDANLSKLFTPLFTTKAKGQGFGLPVCKRLVEAHDGNITVESKVGKGSTFTIKIPLRKEVNQK
jgi:two-component system sporulation sensor kinase A